ncbi:DsbC family protein [Acidovorax cavernicola]|uniref:Thiol:disulfide interchange protein n=1 Tax=Acidovorax cavernicola TaxID=1675792 RepID=A0A9X8D1V7_9BURK|nr:DsbC family protein [Acidovorax cavernicola]
MPLALRRTLLLAACAFGAFGALPAAIAQRRSDTVEGRFGKLDGLRFDQLPFQDAIKVVHGDGKRQIAVFSDPNCGHCKRVDQDLKTLGNVTVHVFLYPVLGEDSSAKARKLWCARDSARQWEAWIASGTEPAAPAGPCDASALQRNAALGRKLGIRGTPALVFSDSTFVPGAIPVRWIEQLLAAAGPR